MRFPYFGTSKLSQSEIYRTRQQVSDFVRIRGTEKPPGPPRNIILQSAPRGVYVAWGLPPGDASDIAGWRIYKDDEKTLLDKIGDRGTRQYFVPATAGSSPPTINIFISSVNAIGVESTKVQVQGKATVESGAPTLPSPPPGFSTGAGSDTSGGLGTRVAGNTGFADGGGVGITR